MGVFFWMQCMLSYTVIISNRPSTDSCGVFNIWPVFNSILYFNLHNIYQIWRQKFTGCRAEFLTGCSQHWLVVRRLQLCVIDTQFNCRIQPCNWPRVCWTDEIQGDHLSGKPGNVREFDSCRGNVSDITKSREMSELSGKKSCQGKVA